MIAPLQVAMLTLTAVHDIMKLPSLLPTVSAEDAPYHAFAAGERIEDHDVALGCAHRALIVALMIA
jgi:hypothetical protein|eukprot:3433134-Prymnesium_polylepis.1